MKGKQIVVFLDYDGTLSPIVSDPDRAFMSDQMRSGVREVARLFPTAIISGRSRDKVRSHTIYLFSMKTILNFAIFYLQL